MVIDRVEIEEADLRRLLGAASGDAALLYLFLRCGNEPEQAIPALHLTGSRYQCASATLRQLGLWPEKQHRRILTGERPQYTEQEVRLAQQEDDEFPKLLGEVQRQLGRILNNEELKIILGFVRYLGLPADVICLLVYYCKDRNRQRGNLRNPSLRSIEKEAYAWAEQGLDTAEAASAYIQQQNLRHSRIEQLKRLLQIYGRNLTPAEERYAASWLDMGFEDEVISMAYERTCINTGGLKWPYMNGILTRWHEAGLHTAEQIRSGDRKPGARPQAGERQLDTDEQAAIARMLREG